MRFNPDLTELIPKEQLDSAFGGDFEYEFEPVSYWEQIVSYVSLTTSPASRTNCSSMFAVRAESRRMGHVWPRRTVTVPRK